MTRKIVHRSRGFDHGPIVRLMSPTELGVRLKPFVFLDLFEIDMRMAGRRPLHPHSGIATATIFTDGDVTFDDPQAGRGTLSYGGVEWARAGKGMWHGNELSSGTPGRVRGFQLWIALPPELELLEADVQYVEANRIPVVGPACLVIGRYGGEASPVRSPAGLNYLLVTLKPGERWRYEPPPGHNVVWGAIAKGALAGQDPLSKGEIAVFDESEDSVMFEGANDVGATFVLGSAVPHPHHLHLGPYSVHTSAEALIIGEQHIRALKFGLDAVGDRRTDTGSTPAYRG